jgi:hypothetical protein
MGATTAVQKDFTYLLPNELGGETLLAAGLVAASAQGSGVTVGRGWHDIQIITTAIEIATGDENYIFDIEANTVAAPSTWVRLATVATLGAATPTGRNAGDVAANSIRVAIFNPNDYQIRLNLSVIGTIASGINATVKVLRHVG